MFKLLKGKNNEFSCELEIEGLSNTANIKPRLFFESSDNNEYVFLGKLSGNKCNISIGKLNELNLPNSGKMRLEVIIDDTVFIPYENTFEIASVKMVEAVNNITTTKPTVRIKETITLNILKEYLAEHKFDGTIQTLYSILKNDQKFKTDINEYCKVKNIKPSKMIKLLIT